MKQNTEETKKEAFSKELAIEEIQKFVEKYDDKKKKDWEIEKEYPNVLESLIQGLLVFDTDLKPIYTLKYPVLNDKEEVAVSEVKFKTRIKPGTLSDIMKGLDISNNQMEYTLRCLANITGQPKAMLDKFEKFDYKTIEQISAVFM